MLVMVKEDILANKLLALLTRSKPASRDFFDSWFFLKEHWQINYQLINNQTKLSPKQLLTALEEKVESQNQAFFLQGLGELIDFNKKEWVRQNLKEELLFQLRLRKSEC